MVIEQLEKGDLGSGLVAMNSCGNKNNRLNGSSISRQSQQGPGRCFENLLDKVIH